MRNRHYLVYTDSTLVTLRALTASDGLVYDALLIFGNAQSPLLVGIGLLLSAALRTQTSYESLCDYAYDRVADKVRLNTHVEKTGYRACG